MHDVWPGARLWQILAVVTALVQPNRRSWDELLLGPGSPMSLGVALGRRNHPIGVQAALDQPDEPRLGVFWVNLFWVDGIEFICFRKDFATARPRITLTGESKRAVEGLPVRRPRFPPPTLLGAAAAATSSWVVGRAQGGAGRAPEGGAAAAGHGRGRRRRR